MGALKLLGPDGEPLPDRKTLRDLAGLRPQAQGGGFSGRDSYYAGASLTNGDLAAWTPFNVSGQQALSLDRDTLASRVHDLTRNDGWASAGITRQVDSIIGSGWRLSAKPNARSLKIAPDAAAELAQQIEAAWRDYADDPDSCDAGQKFTMGALLALAFRHRVKDGEAIAAILWLDRGTAFSTAIQIVSPDRLSNPQKAFDTATLRSGIELGLNEEPIAYHFRKSHPGDIGVIGAYPWIWERVARTLPNGRRQIVHAFEANEAGMMRGEPPLAPVLKKLRMMGRYDEAELQAAVLNALLAAFIKSPNDHDQIASAMSGSDDLSELQTQRMGFYGSSPVSLPGVKLNFLFPQDEVQLTHPTHPNSGFEPFFRAGLRNIAAATGLSYEQLSMDWSQVNYSSARAALLEVWRGFTARKDHFAAQFMAPIYGAWLEEAIARGRVKLPAGAPPFREARQAYCAARWIGPARGWVDPEKEARAAIERLSAGLSTYEREAAEQGIDYIELFDQQARERQEQIARGIDPDALLRSKLPQQTQPGDKQPAAPPSSRPAPGGNADGDGNTDP